MNAYTSKSSIFYTYLVRVPMNLLSGLVLFTVCYFPWQALYVSLYTSLRSLLQIHVHSFLRLHSLGAFCWSSDPVCAFASGKVLLVEQREVYSVVVLAREHAESTLGPSTAITLSWKVCGAVIPKTPWGFLRHREASHLLLS